MPEWLGCDCGRPHPQGCHGHTTRGPCKLPPIKGGVVCHIHGGSAPQVRAKANERLAVAEMHAELARIGRPVEVDPGEALLQVVWADAGNVGALRLQVEALDPDDYAGATGNKHKTNEAAPHVLVTMYRNALDDLARHSKMAIDAGIEERRVRIAERDTERLFTAVQKALLTIGDEGVRERFVQALAGELRAGTSVPLGV